MLLFKQLLMSTTKCQRGTEMRYRFEVVRHVKHVIYGTYIEIGLGLKFTWAQFLFT